MPSDREYCSACGAQLPALSDECRECGHEPTPHKRPWLAVVLSVLLTGAGQLYVGKVRRGLAWLGGAVAFAAVLVVAVPSLTFLAYLLPVAAAADAYVMAMYVNDPTH
ncbi:hypothetical protein [Haloarcula litorea]|uniref:hypothetical protein n=1 Tax=Haloarcula litorea TaxID=3032579 RepID=UPI0023E85AF6|nr:hypothetical protein [Halomicroarcula sp. GDY20]